MSSIAVIQQTDAIHFITDGAAYDTHGVMTDRISKVAVLGASGCAMALRGAAWVQPALHIGLCFLKDFDAITDALPQLLKGIRDEYVSLRGPGCSWEERSFEVTVGGWSERWQRMVAVVASTWEVCDPEDSTGHSHMDGYQPFVPWVPGQGYTAPPIDFEGAVGRDVKTQADIDALDPLMDGFALHEAQRLNGGIYCARPAYIIGGFAELTTIRRDHIARHIIHEWPDVIGEKIAPAGAAPIEFGLAVFEADQARSAALKELERATAGAAAGYVRPTPAIPLPAQITDA